MIAGYTKFFFAAIFATSQNANAWIPTTARRTRYRGKQILTYDVSPTCRSFTNLSAEKTEPTTTSNEENDDDNTTRDEVDNKPKVEWGVSYIGGDPCGSKLNSDPFDTNPSNKPGLPDDMKARIEALAQKKLQEEHEKNNQ